MLQQHDVTARLTGGNTRPHQIYNHRDGAGEGRARESNLQPQSQPDDPEGNMNV